jgi:ribonuclease HI
MAVINIYSDGSFYFGRKPTFGWLAAGSDGNILAQGCGVCDNDGSNNVAGEIAGALAALRWAVDRGFSEILIHADLSTLSNHFLGGARRDRGKLRSMSAAAARWRIEHPAITITFRYVRDVNAPLLREAHHLSRSCKPSGMPLAA